MNDPQHRRSGDEILDGYFTGPDAQLAAVEAALNHVDSANIAVLVEGVSDQIALDTLANREGRNLAADGTLIVPVGGAHAFARYLLELGPKGVGLAVAGLCDVGEEPDIRRALETSGVGTVQDRAELEQLGFFVCERDLEDELIRAAGQDLIEAVLTDQSDMTAFRALQKQPEWRGRAFDDQFHRWLRAGARRSQRYSVLLVDRMDLERIPYPLRALLDRTRSG